jgi:hypothetical protein
MSAMSAWSTSQREWRSVGLRTPIGVEKRVPVRVSRRHFWRSIQSRVEHYNHDLPHQALGQRQPILPSAVPRPPGDPPNVRRRDLLGGLIPEYEIAA